MPHGRSRLTIDYANVMSPAVGTDHGLSDSELDAVAGRASAEIQRIWVEFEGGDQRWMALPDDSALADELNSFANQEGPKHRDLILVGIGGSSLGAIATIQALAHPFRNLQPDAQRGGPRLFVLDNPDPEKVAARLFAHLAADCGMDG